MHPQVQPAALTPRRALLLCAALTAAAALPRALGCFSDLWLDEAWSWLSLVDLDGPLGVFREIHHSNNHHLVSLWMYALRDAPDPVFRLPSFLAGIASVPLAARLAGRGDPLAAVVAALLVGSCHLLVYFSSEARGYALVACFALAGWAALEAELRSRRAAAGWLFAACVLLGFLSQLIVLFFWAGAFAWSTPRILRDARSAGAATRRLLRLHGLPLLALGALYLADLRSLVVGLGPPFDPLRLLAVLGSFGFGLPVGWTGAALPFGVALAAALGAALLRLRRRGDDRWILHGVVIVLAPAVVLAALRPEVIEARYFVISLVFALVLWSEPLAAALRRGGLARAAAAAALLAFVAGNGYHTVRFLQQGRGGYRDALLFMARETPGARVEVGGNHDFRVPTMLRYYARELPPDKELVYLGMRKRPPGGPAWLVLQDGEPLGSAPTSFRDPRGNPYALAAEYGYFGIAGYHWAVYRNLRGEAPARARARVAPP